jgi:hypothetical protein
MDDTAYRQFFARPGQTYQRQYEALRAVFVDGRSQKDVAEQFGFTYGTMRQLVFEFRQVCDDHAQPTESLFFEMPAANVFLSPRTTNRPPSRR